MMMTASAVMSTTYHCYQDVEGGTKFFIRMPITQVQGSDSAIGKFANGMVALAGMIKRHVAFVEVNGSRMDAEEFIKQSGGDDGSRLIIQYLPASGCKAGILSPGSLMMSHCWLVEANPAGNIESQGNSSSQKAAVPNEFFPVIVISDKRWGIKSVENLKFFDATAFDAEGKMTDEFFRSNRSNMKFIQLERHHEITTFIRIKGQDHWDDMLSEIDYGAGHLYGTNSDLNQHQARALDADCLTEEQAKFLHANWFSRKWTSTKEKAGTVGTTISGQFEKLKLLGQ